MDILRAERKAATEALPPPAERARIRKAYGVSQDAMGKAAGVHRVTISSWERGEAEPEGDNRAIYVGLLREMAAELGTEINMEAE
ncbi:helix-turn-helix domain-containing protein [Streptomyces sp. NRRL S-495]|uniref:helix-turn-helix transcriptional regulator n=1 Tax=Streptomyces sp. NRRL S-495 TaxID=1609133 RepID=UPI00133123D8|nr:helix-turn-helix domain-containing protein [Streptomyces sp. NRRL S-495]